MSRSKISREYYKRSSHEIYQEQLDRINKNKELGWELSKKISERVKKEVGDVEKKNDELFRENEKLSYIKEWLTENNLSINDATSWRGVSNQFKQIILGLPYDFRKELTVFHDKLMGVMKSFDDLLKKEG